MSTDHPIALPRGRAVVHWLPVEDVDDGTVQAWCALLEPAEQARAARFHFAADRVSFMAAHALARTMLAAHGGLAPAAWRFVAGPFGKPELDPAHGRPWLRFNLSHTRGLVACGVAHADDIGVDVEAVERPQGGLGIADRFFTQAEVALIRAVPDAMQREVFFRLWTMKESVMKATGRGFDLPLDAFSVTLDPLGVRFHGADAGPAPWSFVQRAVAPGFMLAAALRSQDAGFEVTRAVAGDMVAR